jgi:hypothetical protein
MTVEDWRELPRQKHRERFFRRPSQMLAVQRVVGIIGRNPAKVGFATILIGR